MPDRPDDDSLPQPHGPESVEGPPWGPVAARLAALLPGVRLEGPLGRGGAGWVFRGHRGDRPVAVKALATPAGARREAWAERFEREVEALERLEHPGIVRILGAGMEGDLAWIVMDLVEGTTLRSLLADGALPVDEALAIARGMAEALDHAHRRGVVHRDVKPENVLVDEDGQVRLVDFGLARIVSGDGDGTALTRPTQALGTLRYMAPEQLDAPSEVDHRADVYSLGVVVYEMLTGVVPHGVVEAPSSFAGVPKELDRGVLRALSRDPARRPDGAISMLAELDLNPAREIEQRERRRNRRIDLGIFAVFTGVPAVLLTTGTWELRVPWGFWGLSAVTAAIVNSPALVRLYRGTSAAPLARFACGSAIWLLIAPGSGSLSTSGAGYALPVALIAGTVQLAAVSLQSYRASRLEVVLVCPKAPPRRGVDRGSVGTGLAEPDDEPNKWIGACGLRRVLAGRPLAHHVSHPWLEREIKRAHRVGAKPRACATLLGVALVPDVHAGPT